MREADHTANLGRIDAPLRVPIERFLEPRGGHADSGDAAELLALRSWIAAETDRAQLLVFASTLSTSGDTTEVP